MKHSSKARPMWNSFPFLKLWLTVNGNCSSFFQIAKLVLERGHRQAAEPCLSTNDRKEDQCAVVSVATSFTDGSKDYCFLTDGERGKEEFRVTFTGYLGWTRKE